MSSLPTVRGRKLTLNLDTIRWWVGCAFCWLGAAMWIWHLLPILTVIGIGVFLISKKGKEYF